MDIKTIASIKGEGGLFNVMKTNPSGEIIVCPLDKNRAGIVMVRPAHKVTLLDEVSIYMKDKKNVPLQEVLYTIWKKFGETLTVKPDDEPQKLNDFMKSILPQYDQEKVYLSEIKKLVKWYVILLQDAPEAVKNNKASPPTSKTATSKKSPTPAPTKEK